MAKRRTRAAKHEWVALMALIADRNREEFRVLRKEAWDSAKFHENSRESN